MNRCSHPEHPHCTVWVMPGESACAHGHVQPAAPALAAGPEPASELLDAASGPIATPASPPQRPHLHVSGFDPRAAGGRQVLKLELRGMPPGCAPQVSMLAASRLRLECAEPYRFTRTARGEWLPVFLEFSSRGLEHGQYRIELALHSRPDGPPGAAAAPARSWIATLLLLAPRLDASLHDIHQTFLATHKNVRVSAVDASIARVKAGMGGGSVDIDVSAGNAGIAHLDLDAGAGKIDLGFSSIAWDEDLLEIDPAPATRHPCPASTACLVFDAAGAGASGLPHGVRHLRLFALDECVLGRYEPGAPEADLLLAHHGAAGPAPDGLTRRISARHALIRRGRDGFDIEDVSRFGLLLDGVWPGKHAPTPLRQGMRIELTASIPGVAVLEVGAILPNGIILHRIDAGMACEAFYLVEPECTPAPGQHPILSRIFHRDGGFWQRDPAGGAAMPLTPASGGEARFVPRPYPELDAMPAGRSGSMAHQEENQRASRKQRGLQSEDDCGNAQVFRDFHGMSFQAGI